MPNLAPSSDTASVTMTGKKLLKAALLKLGAYDPDEELQPADIASGQEALNLLLDSANLERLLVYNLAEEASVVTNLREPTIGPGGTCDTIRPSVLREGQVFLRVDEIDYKLLEMTAAEWAGYAGMITPTSQPSRYWYEPSFPLGILHLDYTPDQQYQVVIFKWKVLNQIVNMQATLNLPPGYFRWLVYELALDLRPEYPSSTADMAIIAETARRAKAAIKRVNNQTPDILGDKALRCQGSQYDIRSDRDF
jgi:hypothetical protein